MNEAIMHVSNNLIGDTVNTLTVTNEITHVINNTERWYKDEETNHKKCDYRRRYSDDVRSQETAQLKCRLATV